MCRLILIFSFIGLLSGCSTTYKPPAQKSVATDGVDGDLSLGDIVVYGRLRKEVLQKPTAVFYSAFGHSYCMSQEVVYDVDEYLQGSGPATIKFSQHKIDYCWTLTENIGFNESILFLSKNKHRGVWSTGSAKIFRYDGKADIFTPKDIMQFVRFENFDAFLLDHDKPIDWTFELGHTPIEGLEILQERGVLTYESDPRYKGGEFYHLKLYKYIDIDLLLKELKKNS